MVCLPMNVFIKENQNPCKARHFQVYESIVFHAQKYTDKNLKIKICNLSR